MKNNNVIKIILLTLLVGCATIKDPDNKNALIGGSAGAVVGGGLGAVVGTSVGSPSGGIATGMIVGTAAGTLIGHSIDEDGKMDRNDSEIKTRERIIGNQKADIETVRNDRFRDGSQRDSGYVRAGISTNSRESFSSGEVRMASANDIANAKKMVNKPSVIHRKEIETVNITQSTRIVSSNAAPVEEVGTKSESSYKSKEGTLYQKDLSVKADNQYVEDTSVMHSETVHNEVAKKSVDNGFGASKLPSAKIEKQAAIIKKEEPVEKVKLEKEVIQTKEVVETKTDTVKQEVAKVASDTSSNDDCSSAQSEIEKAKARTDSADKLFHVRRAIRLCPNKSDYRIQLSEIYKSLGRVEDADFERKEADRLK